MMARFSHFCSVIVLLRTAFIASTLASPRIRRLIEESSTPSASNPIWRQHVSDYPEKVAEDLLEQLTRHNKINYLLSNEKIKEIAEFTREKDKNITYTNLCSSEIKKDIPRGVVINDEEYFVLNPLSRPAQYIEMEMCSENIGGNPCALVDDAENTYTTLCRQEYITREIYIMPKKNTSDLSIHPILIPSCCSCFIY